MAKKEDLLSLNDSYNVKYSKLVFLGLKPKKDKVDFIVKQIIDIVFLKFIKEIGKDISFVTFCKDNNTRISIIEAKNKYYLDQSIEKDFINSVSLAYLKENFQEFRILLEEYLDLNLKYEEVQLLPKVFEFYIISDLINYLHKPYLYGFLKKIIKKRDLDRNFFNIKEEDRDIFLRQNIHTRKLERYFFYINDFLDEIKKRNIINKFQQEFLDYESFIKDNYKKEIPEQTKSFLNKKLESYLNNIL